MKKLKKWYKQWRAKRKRIGAAVKIAKIDTGEKPLNVIQGRPTAGKSPRNLARIKTCEKMLADLKSQGKHRSDLYMSWLREYKRRMTRFNQNNKRAE